jgi:tetratricopeptide (TPR) repeat protein
VASALAWQWAAVFAENAGELDAARAYVGKALDAVDEATTTWQVATLHTQVAMLDLNGGLYDEAAHHARLAIPLLERLHADEDALAMRTSLALAALHEGDLEGAERVLAEAGEPTAQDVTGGLVRLEVVAELMLARGDVPGALAAFWDAVRLMRRHRFPGVETNGQEPWILVALATALTAHVRYAASPDERHRTGELAEQTARTVAAVLAGPEVAVDYPVTGMGAAALGAWLVTERESDAAVDAGVRLLALARAFGYNRWFPVMAWEPLRAGAEKAAPGRLDAVSSEYDERRGRDLRSEVVAVLAGAGVTSSA